MILIINFFSLESLFRGWLTQHLQVWSLPQLTWDDVSNSLGECINIKDKVAHTNIKDVYRVSVHACAK